MSENLRHEEEFESSIDQIATNITERLGHIYYTVVQQVDAGETPEHGKAVYIYADNTSRKTITMVIAADRMGSVRFDTLSAGKYGDPEYPESDVNRAKRVKDALHGYDLRFYDREDNPIDIDNVKIRKELPLTDPPSPRTLSAGAAKPLYRS